MSKTIRIGMNYISSISTETIKQLMKRGVIDTLKFPGTACNLSEMESFLSVISNGVKTDIHGILNFKPAWNMPSICKNIDVTNSKRLFTTPCNGRFSTHIGYFPETDTDPICNIKENLSVLRKLFPEIQMGGENVFSLLNSNGMPRYMTQDSCLPEFINEMWHILDFGVFDLAHAIIAAKDCKMSLEQYIGKLDKEHVKIIHITGGVPTNISDETSPDQADPHFTTSMEMLNYLKKIIRLFPNVDLVVSECAYSNNFEGQRIPLTEEDYIIEATKLKKALS